MAERMAIPIDKSIVPYRFDMELEGELFSFEVHYNSRFDYFTINVDKDGEVLINGEKIVYGRPMFSGLSDARLPKVSITPTDIAGIQDRAGWNQLGETVFLFLGEVT